MKNQKVSLRLIALDVACALMAAINAYMQYLHYPMNQTSIILWCITSAIWTIAAICNFLRYQKQ